MGTFTKDEGKHHDEAFRRRFTILEKHVKLAMADLRCFYTGEARQGETKIEIFMAKFQFSSCASLMDTVWIDENVRNEN